MNDVRSGSAAGPSEALAADSELAGFAAPAARTNETAPADPQTMTHRDKRLIAISMMLPVFLGTVDQSVLASALPTIGRDLGGVHNLPWLVTAFLIASTALTPLYSGIINQVEAPLQKNMSEQTLERFKTKPIVVKEGAQGQSDIASEATTPGGLR